MEFKNKKIIAYSVGLPLGLIVILIGYAYGKMKYENYLWYKKTNDFTSALQAPFKADVHGGKTPEETWAMYVEAVQRRDVELASKYIDVNHQKDELELNTRVMESGRWDIYVNDLTVNPLQKKDVPEWLTRKNDRAYFYYEYRDSVSNETRQRDVNFYLNPLTGVWKILY